SLHFVFDRRQIEDVPLSGSVTQALEEFNHDNQALHNMNSFVSLNANEDKKDNTKNTQLSEYKLSTVDFPSFTSSTKLLSTFIGHTDRISIRVWDIENNKQVQSFNRHSNKVFCVKFSLYYYHNNDQNVICSSSFDSIIRFGISKIIKNYKY
ncbi:hypothetical protein RFI_22973, partial [Reticulomyxa filosa]